MKPALTVLTALLLAPLAALHAADASPVTLTEGGVARAEIIVAKDRPRMVTLAALELRHFVEKMSGARLPIVTEGTAGNLVKIYIGRSEGTDKLGVTAEGLRDGAYRVVSGPDWLVLIGKDFDFEPAILPLPLKRGDSPKAAEQWNKMAQGRTDAAWGFPFTSGFKSKYKAVQRKQYKGTGQLSEKNLDAAA